MDNYVVYHLHSDLSNGVTNVDSVTKFGEYIEAAKKLGMKAMAFSEHGNIFEWFHKKEAIENAGMKYIHAVEAYITEDNNSDHKRTVYSAIDLFTSSTAKKDVRISFENYYKREDGMYLAKCIDDDKTYPIDPESIREEKVVKTRDNYHCVLIAKNHAGVREINRLTSQSFCRTDSHFYYMPRIYLDDLLNTSDNVIVTSACLGGILSKGTDEVKERFLDFCIKNKHRCYLEIQHHNVEDQKNYNKELYALSREYGIPLIAGTDTHALNDTHMEGRKILQLSKGVHFAEEDAWDLTFKSFETLCEAYKRQDSLPEEVWMEAIMNTNRMADCVETFELDRNTKYPKIYDHPLQTYKQKINQAYKVHPYVRKRYKSEEINPIIRDEVDVYEKTKSIDFMLLQTYLREWETKHDIFCGYGRGSVSGSEVAYILGITQMDSKKFGLNFFRFMNPSRVTNADIDTDYSSRDRDIIKQFILRDHMDLPNIRASEIITFNTIALKGAIKDVGRALRMSIVETSAISEAVYLEDGKWIIDDVFRERYPDLFKYVDIVSGTIVSIGSHPSGVLVSDLNIDEEVGMCSLSTSDYPVSVLNMKELDALMYVKLDILGLDNIGVINETCKLAGIERMTPDNVDLDDEDVWRDIREDTTLIFQWESASAQAYLKRFMSDETIAIAKSNNKDFSYIKWFSFGNGLLRPGCASFRDDVAEGHVLITGFKELDEFLSTTSGRITMQEDIMKFLVNFCGYSDAESDTVRRGIAKKYGTEKFIDEIHDRFISYSNETYGAPKEQLEEIFPPIKQGILDATRYAFSWNHSDAYSCVGYICGYLRYYYPLEFLTAALNTFEGKEEKTLNITNYTKKKGIKVEGVKFRHSTSEYTFNKEENVIYKGIASIKYLNSKVADAFQSIKDMKFQDFIHLLAVVKEKSLPVNSKQMKILIQLNFFEEFGEVKYLLKQYDYFDLLYGKKQMKKDKANSLGIPYEIIKRNSEKESEKTFTKVNMMGVLHDYINVMPYDRTTFVDRVGYQLENLGYIDIVDNQYKGYVVVLETETKYTPKVKVYALANGNTLTVKVAKKDFNRNPLQKGDIVHITNQKKKARMKMSAEGKFVPVEGEFDWWATKYEMVGK